MAKRYGGKFSPDGEDAGTEAAQASQVRGAYEGAQVEPAGFAVNLLFLPALPLVFFSLGDAVGLTLALIGAALLTLAAWLTRDGLRAEAAYNARKVARRPGLPRKSAGSILIGLGIAVAAYKFSPPDGGSVIGPALYGVICTVLHGVAFGLDPMKDKGMEGIDTYQQDRVAKVVTEAESYLSAMSDAIGRASDRKLEARVERFQSTARNLFRTVEEDPRDLTAARKYLTVYLRGARDATVKFADIYARGRDAAARKDYETLLDDLEQNFAARTEKLLLDDHSDLTVEIEVLRDRLQQEGVRLD